MTLTPVASVVAAAIAGEDPALIGPLMESLEHDLLPRDDDAAGRVRRPSAPFDAAVERALRDWERDRGAGGPVTAVTRLDRDRRPARSASGT